MSGKSRSSLVAGLMAMAMALGAAACGAGDDTVGIAESEVGDATSTSGATGDGSEQYAPEPAGDVTGEPVDGAADTGGDTGEALDLSAPVQLQGDIAIPLDSDELVIDATAGQRISVDVTALSGGCAESSIWDLNIGLYDADGAPVGSTGYVGIYGCQPYGPWEMPADGRYTLSLQGGDGNPSTGTYDATVALLSLPSTDVDLSVPYDAQGEIGLPLDSHFYVFDATAGQRISVDVTALSGGCAESSIWDLNIGLYDADGAPVGSTGYVGIYGCQPYGPWEMPADGRYTLSFSGGNGKPSTGAYQASIATLGG